MDPSIQEDLLHPYRIIIGTPHVLDLVQIKCSFMSMWNESNFQKVQCIETQQQYSIQWESQVYSDGCPDVWSLPPSSNLQT